MSENDVPTKGTVNDTAHEDSQLTTSNPNHAAENGAEVPPPEEAAPTEQVFQITVHLPHAPYTLPMMVSPQEQVQDLRQSIIEQPETFQYSCFHLEHQKQRIDDFVEVSEIPNLGPGANIKLIEDPYTEKEARLHILRVRDLIGATAPKVDLLHGVRAGSSLYDSIATEEFENGAHALSKYDLNKPYSATALVPPPLGDAPRTIKSISLSAWNPPPQHLRHKGHLLYLQATTSEGEQFQITSHVSGFYVNRSSNAKFDPFPKPSPKNAHAHSLIGLFGLISPSFDASFRSLQEFNSRRDPLVNIAITNTIPATPWLVASSEANLSTHVADSMRPQETYLIAGVESSETLRDWNEEFQATRELPRETVPDRVFREKITSKLFADYNEAAARGAILVARGEVLPLNPTEQPLAQIFVYNNIFYSYGADGMSTFSSDGGDEAARAAVGKDVVGVKLVNQQDIPGLFTPGTVIVDYLGKRLVAQSIVPGIFKQREPGEHQIDYGGAEGRDIVTTNEKFVEPFGKLAKALRTKRHDVWDKDGAKFTLEASVETKGLLGTDGRKYVLDLYRLTPLDVTWLEKYWEGKDGEGDRYPHRMAVLRHELVETYWRVRMSQYVREEVEKRRAAKAENGEETKTIEAKTESDKAAAAENDKEAEGEDKKEDDRVDISEFNFLLNPDVYCGQVPQTDEEKAEWVEDEKNVKAVCAYLVETIIPELLRDLKEGDVGFPMDGHSLSRLMHRRGINLRYLGTIFDLARKETGRLVALQTIALQEMVARAFKHIANKYLKNLADVHATSCVAHLLNCLLGAELNKEPKAALNDDLVKLYPDSDYSFKKITPQGMVDEVAKQISMRYQTKLYEGWEKDIKPLQVLREISLKYGLQLIAKDYAFTKKAETNGNHVHFAPTTTNGATHPPSSGGKKKKKGGAAVHSDISSSTESLVAQSPATTFVPEDIINIVAVVKDSCPKSMLAEEALEAGRISMAQNQRDIGQELLLESLSLHEQIYGILHPEVARIYHQLSMFYYQMDEKNAAVELAHKAVIVSERTIGLDSTETVLSYLNLGLFEHANGNSAAALQYMRHALDLWKIVYGPNHPDSITTINNAAVILQNLKAYHDSRIWFEKSIEICELVNSGTKSIHHATLSFQLAQALALDSDAKASVNKMREAYSTFKELLGSEDRNTKEAETWLEQLTQNAVNLAKHAKDVQSRKMKKLQLGATAPRVVLAGQGQGAQSVAGASTTTSASSAALGSALNSKSVDEIIRFIEGGGDSTRAAKKSRGQPGLKRGGKV